MRPVPVVFHLGPLAVHTYGIGLAVTFWFGYRYFARRLRAHGYPDGWLANTFVWIVVSAIVGARAVHVIANLSYYEVHPAQIPAIWQGGLTSFGGLLLGVPIGLWSAHRRCPLLRPLVAADLVAPVLVAAWALGRLLGPQLMVAGGGKPTSAWFGMYYAGEVGKRLPVPIFQAIECFVIYLIALRVERLVSRRGGPLGVVVALSAGLWGLSRFFDEYVLLTHDVGTDAVEITSLAFFAVGVGAAAVLWRRHPELAGPRKERAVPEREPPPGGEPGRDPWAAPAGRPAAAGLAEERIGEATSGREPVAGTPDAGTDTDTDAGADAGGTGTAAGAATEAAASA